MQKCEDGQCHTVFVDAETGEKHYPTTVDPFIPIQDQIKALEATLEAMVPRAEKRL